MKANLIDDDVETAEATTATSATTTTTQRIVDDNENDIDHVWPGRTDDDKTFAPAEATTTTTTESAVDVTAAAEVSNITYHFHGDYETVDDHKVGQKS